MAEAGSRVAGALRAAVAPFLLLVTPFAIFLKYHGYPFTRPEIGICVLALALVALAAGVVASWSRVTEVLVLATLLTLFADIQFHPPKGTIGLAALFLVFVATLWILRRHAAQILSLTVATMLIASLVLPQPPTTAGEESFVPKSPPHSDLPFVLHVLLDEQIGIEGLPASVIPPDTVKQLQAFYEQRGFLLFGRAYSKYYNSDRSIGHLLNIKNGRYVPTLIAPGASGLWKDLRRNAYFARFAQQGYAIRVYQPDYMDLCADPRLKTSCYTYDATSLHPLVRLAMPVSGKVRVVAGMYLDRSTLYNQVRRLYKLVRKRLAGSVHLPAWNWERNRLSPASSLDVLDKVRADVANGRPGEMVFAHLLLPHYPYVFDAQCRPRPTADWLERLDHDDAPPGAINSPQGRAIRYAHYIEQVRCTHKKLAELVAAIPPALQHDAIVVVNGDHGSRIPLVEPIVPHDAQMSSADYTDSFSTMFAVRSPDIAPGYDRRIAPITCILWSLVETNFRSADGVDGCAGSPSVFMAGGGSMAARPLPAFGRAPDVGLVADSAATQGARP
jgi:hypothetical protein